MSLPPRPLFDASMRDNARSFPVSERQADGNSVFNEFRARDAAKVALVPCANCQDQNADEEQRDETQGPVNAVAHVSPAFVNVPRAILRTL